ncbi:hypothetical protein BGX27_007858 [Mortierella sp. AM989]|nr:hypothetical protein BGX27_007858 [Mortierella sp. AM989]
MQFKTLSFRLSLLATIVLAMASLSASSALPANEQSKSINCDLVRCMIPDCSVLRCVNPHLIYVPGRCCPICTCGYDK